MPKVKVLVANPPVTKLLKFLSKRNCFFPKAITTLGFEQPAIVVVLLLASLGATKDSYHCQGRAQMVELEVGVVLLGVWLVGGSVAM